MDIFKYDLDKIDIGKIIYDETKYLEVLNLQIELPLLECINGVCQKINSSIKKDIYFLDLKLITNEHEQIISRILEIENKVIQILETDHIEKVNYFYNFPLPINQEIKNAFKSSILKLNDNAQFLRLKLPHDNIQFRTDIVNEQSSFIEDIKFGTSIKVSIECLGVWFSNQKIGLSWSISKISF